MKENHNFRRFLTRGKKNVKVEFLLLALAYNLNKLHHKIQQNRLGCIFLCKSVSSLNIYIIWDIYGYLHFVMSKYNLI
ncbi:MAG: transposase [Terrisporobacter sp.]